MPPITAEQAQFLLQVSLASMQSEQASTLRIIEAIPVDKSDYSPDDVSMSALNLAWHTAAVEKVISDGIITGAFDFSGFEKPDSIQNSAHLSTWYTGMIATQSAALAQLTPEQLTKFIDLGAMLHMPAVMYLGFMLNHSIHHRGQLSTYLRPMGAKVPAIYGESHDSKLAKASA